MHEYFQGTVGERIQDLLREKKMTQAVLAQRTQISKATLNRYITDENSRIPHDALLQIARVLGVSTDFLLGATDIPYRTNYDIEELGLTAAAAAKLYTGELNPQRGSQGCASGHEESHDSFDAAGYDHDPCRFRKPACRPQEAGG